MKVKSTQGGIIDLFWGWWEMRRVAADNVDLIVTGLCDKHIIIWYFDARVSWKRPKPYYRV